MSEDIREQRRRARAYKANPSSHEAILRGARRVLRAKRITGELVVSSRRGGSVVDFIVTPSQLITFAMALLDAQEPQS